MNEKKYEGYEFLTGYEFWKGYEKKTGQRVVGYFMPEPQEAAFGEYHIGVVQYLDGHLKNIRTKKDAYDKISIERTIGPAEFNFLANLGTLSTEIFLNQYTGGFPNEKSVNNLVNALNRDLSKVIKEQCDSANLKY